MEEDSPAVSVYNPLRRFNRHIGRTK
jgi:hypothetical protein